MKIPQIQSIRRPALIKSPNSITEHTDLLRSLGASNKSQMRERPKFVISQWNQSIFGENQRK